VKANPCTCLILFLRMLRFISASGPVDHITEALGSLTTSGDDSKEKEKIPSSAPGSSNRRKNDPLTGSAVQRQPIDRREELCQRHVQQLFIRGEQVALVSVLPLWHLSNHSVSVFADLVSSYANGSNLPRDRVRKNKEREAQSLWLWRKQRKKKQRVIIIAVIKRNQRRLCAAHCCSQIKMGWIANNSTHDRAPFCSYTVSLTLPIFERQKKSRGGVFLLDCRLI